ncbi:hypothetical protein [Hafnia paralvei]|uniref:hypothetical protein n=1 Tax=Hafnia paralvei TaxID=546367 RepID=UPI0026720B25|nr:hypothetical protein [Hafnia paralvei]
MHYEFIPPAFIPLPTKKRKHLVAILRSAGLTLTNHRLNLLHYLTQTTIPVTAHTLSMFADVPLSSAYRNLSTLSDSRVVGYIVDRSGVTRWFLMIPGKRAYCPACNQELNVNN